MKVHPLNAAIMVSAALMLAGCASGVEAATIEAGSVEPARATASPHPTESAVAPHACITTGMDFAVHYGVDAQLSGSAVVPAAELSAWEAERLGASQPTLDGTEGDYTLCRYSNVMINASRPYTNPDVPYTVLTVLIAPDGTADLYSAAPDSAEANADWPTTTD